MFWAFYNDYKKILKSRNSTLMGTLKEISKTDFILLVSIIFTALAYGVTITIWKEMWSFIFVVSFVLLIFIYCKRPKEKKRFYKRISETSQEKHKTMLRLLQEYNIDINNEEEINKLIEYITEYFQRRDPFKEIKKAYKNIAVYIFLPLITLFLNELFSETTIETMFNRALLLILFVTFFILAIVAFYSIIDDILTGDRKIAQHLIEDIKEVSLFRNTNRDNEKNNS